jgi:hypothetical protein
MPGTHNHTSFIGWDGILLTFCPGWPQTSTWLISTSQVARLIGMIHHTWPHWDLLKASSHLSSHVSSGL